MIAIQLIEVQFLANSLQIHCIGLFGPWSFYLLDLRSKTCPYKRVEEDQQQGKGKTKIVPQDRRYFRLERYNNNRPRRDFAGHTGSTTAQVVSTVFKEFVHQILEKIKNEPYFKWPNKMGGDPTKRNQSLHCQYHQDWGHTTEECGTLWNHLE